MSGLRCAAVMGVLIAAGAGCLRPEFTPTRLYALAPEISAPAAEPSGASLGVRPLDAARPYRERMMYRDETNALEPYYGVEWAESPRDAVTAALKDVLRDTGHFGDVGDATHMLGPDYLLMGVIRRFEEDRAASPPEAVIELRLELRDGAARTGIWSDTILVRTPMERPGPEALAAAMSEAVAEAVAEAARSMLAR